MSHFDEEALTWDENPLRRQRAQVLADALRPLIQSHKLKKGLDFGGGTGLVSFYLHDDLEQIDLLDVSEGMTAEAQKKIQATGTKKVRAYTTNLLTEEWPHRYDCIYTLLTLHHIHEVDEILKRFAQLLTPGGLLCIADLDKEDGSFHSEYPDFDGYDGFAQEALGKQLENAGFTNVQSKIFYTIDKEFPDGSHRDYPLFFMVGEKKV